MSGGASEPGARWYTSRWFVFVSMLPLWPVSLWFLWKSPLFGKPLKIFWTAASAVLAILITVWLGELNVQLYRQLEELL
ncbi:MAG: hypothetical protein HYY14_06295 [Candidatus Omnitrophica bacterium]|nr:hypothetical protein [Candidatus Omnitrophota bacterium]